MKYYIPPKMKLRIKLDDVCKVPRVQSSMNKIKFLFHPGQNYQTNVFI